MGRVWCVKLRACLAAATRGSVLPGCDDGDGCLRALLRDVTAARLSYESRLRMLNRTRCTGGAFSLRGHVQRDQQQLVPVSQRSRDSPVRLGRCVSPFRVSVFRWRLESRCWLFLSRR